MGNERLPYFERATREFVCSEDGAPILVGAVMLRWTERMVGKWGKRSEQRRVYCQECGELLLDSLTTMEDV